jgi:S-adenosyl-L-methionine hydrolase (adenosine-forming)
MHPIITLTTDFGGQDAFVGTMKGVILSIAPSVQIVDLCHEIPPQNLVAAALQLEAALPYFPEGTIHLEAWRLVSWSPISEAADGCR